LGGDVMNIDDKQLLMDICKYIESMAALEFEYDHGSEPNLKTLIKECAMPDLYFDVLKRIKTLK
jgi:hypothetical protein